MIKKGLKVKILTGKDKNKEGEVIEIDRSNNRAKVKDINMVKKHVKTTKEKKGGIISKENFIDIWLNQKFSQARENLSKSNRNFSPCDLCDVKGTLMGKKHVDAWKKYYDHNGA